VAAYVLDSDLHTWIDFDSDSPLDSDLLAAICLRASAIIDAHCGRVFDAASDIGDVSHYFDAEEEVTGQTLFLDRDLAAVTSITNGDGVVVSSSEYVFLPQMDSDLSGGPFYGIKLLASSNKNWTFQTDPEQAIAIVGKWTYGLTVPTVVVHAAIRLAQWLYKQRSTDSVSDQPLVTATGLTIMPARMPADVQSMLGPFVRMRVGAFG